MSCGNPLLSASSILTVFVTQNILSWLGHLVTSSCSSCRAGYSLGTQQESYCIMGGTRPKPSIAGSFAGFQLLCYGCDLGWFLVFGFLGGGNRHCLHRSFFKHCGWVFTGCSFMTTHWVLPDTVYRNGGGIL